MFLKAESGGGTAVPEGIQYVETFAVEVVEVLEIEVVDVDIDVEIVENVPDAEVIEIITVEIDC